MLNLASDTNPKWLQQAQEGLDLVLIDHAHCEKKAAAYAMRMLDTYITNRPLTEKMTEIVEEELEHFHQVLALLEERNIKFRTLKPSSYGKRLHELVSKKEPQRAVDLLLVASLIEARSCERFKRLAEHIRPTEPKVADFYESLFESEARHHTTYVKLAFDYQPEGAVLDRLKELAQEEAKILALGDNFARMHS
ncbi:MAG: tRNA-(ms[2]io[6]A)-hydroxylase, partial [Pirellulaceae bacterium]|nr:tRNA-(ms[2]io[6]A)-hydroxylase [Pirellulaceae bacterium]